MNVESLSTEQHYSVQQIAKMWGLCENSARDLFRSEPDVLRIYRPASRGKRGYLTLRIPASTVERVHRRMRAAF